MKNGETTKRRPLSALDTAYLDLDWDGVDQCRTSALGALKFHIDTLRNRISDTTDVDEGLHFLVWLMEEQTDRIDSFLERLSEDMRNKKIKLEG